MYISLSIFKNIFSIIFILYLAKKSLTFLKYKNIQKNNKKKLIYEKRNIFYQKYCYKMEIFNILG